MALIAVGVEIPGCSSDAAKEAVSVSSVGPTPAALVGPEEFAARVAEHEVVTINVHVPDEGSIAGTDVWIPFDQVATSTALPQDRSTPLAVYCRSGNMSADAVWS